MSPTLFHEAVETEHEREVAKARRSLAWNLNRANDPTRTRADRARGNELANAARARLRALAAAPTTKET